MSWLKDLFINEAKAVLPGGGSSGGSSGSKALIVNVTNGDLTGGLANNNITAEANMTWADAQAAILDGSLYQAYIMCNVGDEYNHRVMPASIRLRSIDDGMSRQIELIYRLDVMSTGGNFNNQSYFGAIWWHDYDGHFGLSSKIDTN